MSESRSLRESMLAEASKIISGNRDTQYGGPEDSFQQIAKHWSVYVQRRLQVDIEFTPADVATMMVLLKVARLETGGHAQQDTWIDVAGYAACGYEIGVGVTPGD